MRIKNSKHFVLTIMGDVHVACYIKGIKRPLNRNRYLILEQTASVKNFVTIELSHNLVIESAKPSKSKRN